MSTFHYRKKLDAREVAMLAGAAAGAGAAVASVLFYLGRIWIQRVPLDPRSAAPHGPGPDPALEKLAAVLNVEPPRS
jgi:hypothetical protein